MRKWSGEETSKALESERGFASWIFHLIHIRNKDHTFFMLSIVRSDVCVLQVDRM